MNAEISIAHIDNKLAEISKSVLEVSHMLECIRVNSKIFVRLSQLRAMNDVK